jgi:Ca2+-binding RTX toxin-like protein
VRDDLQLEIIYNGRIYLMALLPSVWQENTNDNTAVSVGDHQFYVNSEKSWSFDSKDNNTIRFEVRKGDQYVSSGYTDSAGVERSEMGDVARYAINQNISVEYKFMIEPGAKNTAKWMVLGQLHSAMNMSPPIEIKFNGNDKMKISGNSGSTSNPVYRDIYTDSQDIVRGHWYTMKLNVKFDASGKGSADIWRDGVQIVDYNGALGYTDQTQTYWKEGVYRSTASETTAVNFKDLAIKTGAGAFTASATASATAAQTSAQVVSSTGKKTGSDSSDVMHGSAGRDQLYGGGGDDALYGYAAKDKLDGGLGNDRLDGGSFGDTLLGRTGNDTLYGQTGNDHLDGGNGHDGIYAGAGADILSGQYGNDVLDGGSGRDQILGGADNDVLFGRSGNDRLIGGDGNDRLAGGSGVDVLTGGKGADAFVLTGALGPNNADRITDFNAAADRIELASSVFSHLSKGALAASAFHIGSSAAAAHDHIIYNSTTGAVYYDPDGVGAAAQIHVATLTGAPHISAADFFVI